ncbi:MAG TPA: nuclear transport factor 2 family protein [Bryobacteraceae bacterium]|nr:nuclear transport factor 2 family protein [Bryobacteraceae bacterium]
MFRWKAAVAALSLALIVMVWMLAEQQRASAAGKSLTALDYAEIGQLVNRYGQAIDTCSNNGYDYADLYTPDGVFIDKITPDGFAKGGVVLAKGREQLAEVVGGGKFGCKRPTKGPTATPGDGPVAWNGWSHVMVDHVVTPTADGATGRVYLLMLGMNGPGSLERQGGYEDVYVKTAGGWRIKSRTHVRLRAWHNPLLQTPDLQ